jgi:hypothetical protein
MNSCRTRSRMIALTSQTLTRLSKWVNGIAVIPINADRCPKSYEHDGRHPLDKNQVRKTCLARMKSFTRIGKTDMAESGLVCPSCKKRCIGDGRYCIYCGSILEPIYCSLCGTANPDDLEQCLECGSPMPKLVDVRWAPTVAIAQPTSVMSDQSSYATDPNSESITFSPRISSENKLSRLIARFRRKERSPD